MNNYGWVVGALAVIVVTEHPAKNLGRVVTLREPFADNEGRQYWAVEDGGLFEGYMNAAEAANEFVPFTDMRTEEALVLGIAQWKLRLLKPGEFTEEIDGLVYTVEHADA